MDEQSLIRFEQVGDILIAKVNIETRYELAGTPVEVAKVDIANAIKHAVMVAADRQKSGI